ncbi:hypothetical protein [Aphanizomenon sp. UHCC 0183]|uniref:hypothetical protein n=1 Tax=Aphanizomenon sp. UHCC 0183 TaxID=2590028 RepID=UPI00144557EF|nr:hypothetical protein [Aphanizomenon sp. UHCC 0183]MTJ32511.1 hypothetical protein [Aphanizomenon sp. UHCC 0183]
MKVNIFYPLGHDEYLSLRSQLKPNELDIYLYLITKHPFKDSKIEIDTALISEQLGYHRRTVQLAINKLVSLNILEVEITRFKYRQARIITQDSESVDRQSESVDRQSESVDRQSESVDRFRRTEPAPSKASEVLHTIQTYKTYTDSLSKSERESFLEFAKKKASELPKPPTLISNWIKTHWEDLRSQWEKSQGKVSALESNKWDNHPQREEWLEKIRQLGSAGFQAEDMPNQKIRREFYVWADANNLIWGNEA